MTTAFVLSGGANLGAFQVGMLRALVERGVTPDLLIGASVGAFNAGFLAGRGVDASTVEELADVWRPLSVWKLFPPNPFRIIGALTGHQPALVGDHGLRSLLDRHLRFTDIADSRIPLRVVATDLLSGNEVGISAGPATEAILASAAIPGLLPPVDWNGRKLVDGGIADNTPISDAIDADVDRIYVLPCGYQCGDVEPPSTVAATLLHTMTLLIHKRLIRDVREYDAAAELVVLPPPCPVTVGALDFGQADLLMTQAYDAASMFLDTDGGLRTHPADHIEMSAG
ncbi:patatin-like phospholipase family protein [Gordonia sp. HY002]|uniref:patatin-like phospholipase family protein n=1 Tax=Gordonia zhenghanii TaxID=2911516 RepID=UPI001EF0F5C1|nr:patatin-like phospholipase family protein [Gordonia zhenghanii]MCF8572086.1 patatin-like phospholipase family protein [Gordonia zhenghanii]MCF8602960.1 patatin-like phospholipase family protein [Gordonia zhenghanii]